MVLLLTKAASGEIWYFGVLGGWPEVVVGVGVAAEVRGVVAGCGAVEGADREGYPLLRGCLGVFVTRFTGL
jgi:hypothetical protein